MVVFLLLLSVADAPVAALPNSLAAISLFTTRPMYSLSALLAYMEIL